RAHGALVALLAATDDRVRDVEGGQPHRGDRARVEADAGADLLGRVERGLGVDLGVVPLDDRATHRLEVLVGPVDGEVTGDGLLEALVALEDLLWAGDATAGQERGEGALLGDLRVGQSLPVAEVAGAGDAQGVVGRPRDRDRVG